jgi:hypothetical protein
MYTHTHRSDDGGGCRAGKEKVSDGYAMSQNALMEILEKRNEKEEGEGDVI